MNGRFDKFYFCGSFSPLALVIVHQVRLIDWAVVYVPLDTKQIMSETFHQANLLAWYGKN